MLTPNPPTTLNQAFALADTVLENARDMRLTALTTGAYASEAANLHLLTTVGTIVAARWEIAALAPDVDNLRRYLTRTKPAPPAAQFVLDALRLTVLPLSTVAREAVNLLPELAAEIAQSRADTSFTKDVAAYASRFSPRTLRPYTATEIAKIAATARAHASDAAAMLDRLPAALIRIKEAAENGNNLNTASTWLK